MKVAIQYSGHLRFIKETYSQLKNSLVANENIEFYIFVHTWDQSKQEDIDYMINTIKPHRYLVDTQKNFERHPYLFINALTKPEDYKNNKERLEHNIKVPNDAKLYYEVPSESNNFAFNKDLEVVKMYYYSHYPYNTLSLFYSIHQLNILTNSYKQEHNISFDFVIRMRSDMQFTNPINLSYIDKNKITLFEATPHNGELGKYTIQDQFAIGNEKNMNIYNDLFIYLPCYYFIFKLDWISEILVGFHLQYNNISINKIPRHFHLLRYQNHDVKNGKITRPVC